MSQKIPFLQMFAALRRWTELSNGVEGWLIVSAAIDRAGRSAEILAEEAEEPHKTSGPYYLFWRG